MIIISVEIIFYWILSVLCMALSEEIFSTVSISGAYFLMVVSTPAFSVIWFTLQAEQFPINSTITFLSSSIAIRLISPPSEIKNGLISSKAFSTFLHIFSEVVIIILFFYGRTTRHSRYFYRLGRREVFISLNYFFYHVSCDFYKGLSYWRVFLHGSWTAIITCFTNALYQWHFAKERHLQVGC